MDFYDAISSRRSIRAYSSETVSDEILNRIADAMYKAPSACNRQPYRFLAIRTSDLREDLCEVVTWPFLKTAPVIIVALGNTEAAWVRPSDNHSMLDVDVAIAMEHLVLAAANEGLGTCWLGSFNVDKVNAALGIKAPWTTVALSPLGYPAEAPREFTREKGPHQVLEVLD